MLEKCSLKRSATVRTEALFTVDNIFVVDNVFFAMNSKLASFFVIIQSTSVVVPAKTIETVELHSAEIVPINARQRGASKFSPDNNYH